MFLVRPGVYHTVNVLAWLLPLLLFGLLIGLAVHFLFNLRSDDRPAGAGGALGFHPLGGAPYGAPTGEGAFVPGRDVARDSAFVPGRDPAFVPAFVPGRDPAFVPGRDPARDPAFVSGRDLALGLDPALAQARLRYARGDMSRDEYLLIVDDLRLHASDGASGGSGGSGGVPGRSAAPAPTPAPYEEPSAAPYSPYWTPGSASAPIPAGAPDLATSEGPPRATPATGEQTGGSDGSPEV